jgi:heptosyltransferase-1
MCVLAASGGWGAKQWPAAKYGELAIALKAMGFDVVVNASKKDDLVSEEVVAASGGACRQVVCNVTGLIALMRRADLVVGGDTGPVHLAAALAAPVVALFGPTSPERNGPWGPGISRVLRDHASVTSYRKSDAVDPGLAHLSVESVMSAVQELLGR